MHSPTTAREVHWHEFLQSADALTSRLETCINVQSDALRAADESHRDVLAKLSSIQREVSAQAVRSIAKLDEASRATHRPANRPFSRAEGVCWIVSSSVISSAVTIAALVMLFQ